jgi:hypothetical protein
MTGAARQAAEAGSRTREAGREAAVGVTIFFGGHHAEGRAPPLDPPKKIVGPRRP